MKYLEYLESFSKFKMDGGYKPGLERVQAALDKLGNPERQLPIIHLAGTNGKGSTSAMLASVLKEAGYTVGLYTSPHLAHFSERFRINGVPISEDELEQFTAQIKPYMDELEVTPGLGRPSYFEVITVLAFLYFAAKKVDVLILEVGLGGRLDATNVVRPLASVITTIGFDHMEYLGNTLGAIATEKAGIIKNGVPVIVGVQDEEAYQAIAAIAQEHEAPLYRPVSCAQWMKREQNLCYQTIDLRIGARSYPELEIALPGEHQIRNAIVTIETIEQVRGHFPKLEQQAIYTGLKKVKWPGRLELVQEKPAVILDGAHNIEGIEALATFLEQVKGSYRKLYLVMSILRDKETAPMVQRIAPLATNIVFTQNHSLRVSDANELAGNVLGGDVQIEVIPDFKTALKSAIAKAGEGDLVCISGSLYTITEARQLLLPDDQGMI